MKEELEAEFKVGDTVWHKNLFVIFIPDKNNLIYGKNLQRH